MTHVTHMQNLNELQVGDPVEYRGEGLFDVVGTAANFVKDNMGLIGQAGSAAGSITNAVKGGIEAARAAEELKKLRDFNDTLSQINAIKDLKLAQAAQPTETPTKTTPISNKDIQDFNKMLTTIKGGKGLKKF